MEVQNQVDMEICIYDLEDERKNYDCTKPEA
jgi:hypothetical protein